MLWQVVSSGVVTYVQGFTDISLDLESLMYSPYHINSRLRLQLNAHNQAGIISWYCEYSGLNRPFICLY